MKKETLSLKALHTMRKLIISSLNFGICLMFFFSACAKNRVIRNVGYDPSELQRGVKNPDAVESFGLVPAATPPLCEPLGSLADNESIQTPQMTRGQLVAVQPEYLVESEVLGGQLKFWRYQKNKMSFGKAQILDLEKLEQRERDLFTSENARFAILPFGDDQTVFAVVDDLENNRIRLYAFATLEQADSSLAKPKQVREWKISGDKVLHFFQAKANEVLVAVRLPAEENAATSSVEAEVQLTRLSWGTSQPASQETQDLGSFRALRTIQIKAEVPEGILYTEGNMFSGSKLFLLKHNDPAPTLLFSGPLLESFATDTAIYAHVLKTPSFALDPVFGYTAVGGLWKIKSQKLKETGVESFSDVRWQRISRINYEKTMWVQPPPGDVSASSISGPIGIYEQPTEESEEEQEANRFLQRLIGISAAGGNDNLEGKDLELGIPCASSFLNPIFYLQDVGVFGISGTQEVLRIAKSSVKTAQ